MIMLYQDYVTLIHALRYCTKHNLSLCVSDLTQQDYSVVLAHSPSQKDLNVDSCSPAIVNMRDYIEDCVLPLTSPPQSHSSQHDLQAVTTDGSQSLDGSSVQAVTTDGFTPLDMLDGTSVEDDLSDCAALTTDISNYYRLVFE